MTLNPSECSLARKYAEEIKARRVAEPEPTPEVKVEEPVQDNVNNEFHDVEEL